MFAVPSDVPTKGGTVMTHGRQRGAAVTKRDVAAAIEVAGAGVGRTPTCSSMAMIRACIDDVAVQCTRTRHTILVDLGWLQCSRLEGPSRWGLSALLSLVSISNECWRLAEFHGQVLATH
eukprot:TRINITY_DN5806_c0_g4_i2.p2 TRINITY_DN5806_c0_g4~~TRINITY_DN5806_c0_g4_i2.p2  ORF type:complete len:120 (-),score=2.82 TRINITY_DN5806_c0_g4_i2:216-575(-)